MIYQVTAKTQGSSFLENNIKVNYKGFIIEIFSDKSNKVIFIRVNKKILLGSMKLPEFIFNYKEQENHKLNIPENKYYEEIINLLKYIESMGSYWFGIEKICWDEVQENYIPENDKERSLLTVYTINYDKGRYVKSGYEIKKDILQRLLKRKEEKDFLTIPFAFFREGRNAFFSMSYVIAIYNFYFFIEGLYGKGNTKNYLVKKEFLKSIHINFATTQVINDLLYDSEIHLRHYLKIVHFLKEANLGFSKEGLIKLIINLRGNLHHFSMKNIVKSGHPFNREKFKSIAFLLMHLCISLINQLERDGFPR